jgi:hypothetical protein
MEYLEIKGKTYIKVSSAARETGYTADYIGQLCRARKIDSQLVGRTWYVLLDQVRDHRRSRGRSSKEKTKEQVRHHIHIAHTTHGPLHAYRPTHKSTTAHTPITYHNDEEALIPIVRKDSSLSDSLESTRLRVASSEHETTIPIPESASDRADQVAVVEEDGVEKKYTKDQPAAPVWNGTIVVSALGDQKNMVSIPTASNHASEAKHLNVSTDSPRNNKRHLTISDVAHDPIEAKQRFLKKMNWAHDLNKEFHVALPPRHQKDQERVRERRTRMTVMSARSRMLLNEQSDTHNAPRERTTVAQNLVSMPKPRRVEPVHTTPRFGIVATACMFGALIIGALSSVVLEHRTDYASGAGTLGSTGTTLSSIGVAPMDSAEKYGKNIFSSIRDMAKSKGL